jgi:hypothetical protein
MRQGKTRSSLLIFYFFIPFSRDEQKINTKVVDEQKINTKNITGETPQPEISQQTHKKHDRPEQGDQHQKYTRFTKTH